MKDNNVYVQAYFRIEAGYAGGYGMTREQTNAFFEEAKALLTTKGFVFSEKPIQSGHCPEGFRGVESLYCHPQSISGYVVKEQISEIEQVLKGGTTFKFECTDTYEEALNYTEEEFKQALDICRAKLENDILQTCLTKRKNLFVASYGAYDRISSKLPVFRHSKLEGIELSYIVNLFEQMTADGKLEKSKIKSGTGYRSLIKPLIITAA